MACNERLYNWDKIQASLKEIEDQKIATDEEILDFLCPRHGYVQISGITVGRCGYSLPGNWAEYKYCDIQTIAKVCARENIYGLHCNYAASSNKTMFCRTHRSKEVNQLNFMRNLRIKSLDMNSKGKISIVYAHGDKMISEELYVPGMIDIS